MSKVTVPKPPQRFDLQKFEQMNEPFAIRVEKHRGSLKYEVTPPAPDEAGWTKQRVRELENWLVNEWSGGGHYTFAITDSSSPQQTMEWTSYYPPADFPEKIPPTLQQGTQLPQPASAPAPAPAPQTSSPTVTKMAPPLGGSMPPASYFQQQPLHHQPQPQQQPQYQPPAFQPQAYYPPFQPQIAGPMASTINGAAAAMTESAELKAMRETVAQMREQAVQREYDRRVAEMKTESDRRFTEMQQSMQAMIDKLTQSMQQQQAKPAIDPVVEQLREQNRRLEEQMTRQREDAERARRDQELRDQIRLAQEESRRQAEEMNRRFEIMIREQGNKGPDPQFMMMMELAKETARSSQLQMERLQTMMMRPQDVLQIAKESSQGADQIAASLTRNYRDVFDLQRAITEQALQMNQGGESPVLGLVEKGVDRLSDLAARYNSAKSKEAVEGMRAQAEVARAQADAVRASQERMSRMAATEAAARSGQTVQASNGVYHGPGAPEQAAIPAQTSARPWAQKKPAAAGGGLNGAPQAEGKVVPITSASSRKLKGKTDEEWFGPMLPNVMELRTAVTSFLDGLTQTPPVKPEGSASPEECAYVVEQGAMQVLQLPVQIPAIRDLLVPGSVADFMDVLLPDAPQQYRDDVAQLLLEGIGDDDEDEDDDDDEDAEAQA